MTTKSFFDPQFGEMIGIREVEQLTGISAHTLRSWRRSDLAHLMKFPHYSSVGSQTVWYRLADVIGWLDANGKAGKDFGLVRAELPTGAEVFIAPVSATIDSAKHKWLSELAKINSDTIEKNGDAFAGWYGKVQELVNPNFNSFRKAVMPDLFRKFFDLPSDYPVEYVWQKHRATHPDEWYVGGTLSLRRLYADAKGWDVTDEELIALPLGDYVPKLNKNN